MPQEQFNPLFTDDPDFFEAERPPLVDSYFAPSSQLPDHYEGDYEYPEREGLAEREPVEFSIPEADENPHTSFEPAEVPAGSTVEIDPPAPDHFIANPDFGDPDFPDTHTIEPPERHDIENSAAQYGRMREPEEVEEAPQPDLSPPSPVEPFDFPEMDPSEPTTTDVPFQPEVSSGPSPAPTVQESSESLFLAPAQRTDQILYQPSWM